MTESKTAPPQPKEPEVDALTFIGGDHSLAVPMSGLLADSPELSDAQLPASQWHKRLSDYLRSPRF